MNMERIEIALFNCRKALKKLHPKMNKEAPCFICKTYREAGEILAELEDLAVLTTDAADAKGRCTCIIASQNCGHYQGDGMCGA